MSGVLERGSEISTAIPHRTKLHLQPLMDWAAAREMCAQEFHLVGKHPLALQIDVFSVSRCERDGQQFHPGLFRTPAGLVIIATAAGSYYIGPDIPALLADRCDMVARQLAHLKALAAIHTQVCIALE